ncbi:hypothetical protein [Spiroplasma endosymbiont of Dioctria linearis]|uniref:hypothetical protein n=1 Tax=Spiroplasma endosymbiont of Dioctria linearis TaxID=3066290 RepID=UPI00313CC9B0
MTLNGLKKDKKINKNLEEMSVVEIKKENKLLSEEIINMQEKIEEFQENVEVLEDQVQVLKEKLIFIIH